MTGVEHTNSGGPLDEQPNAEATYLMDEREANAQLRKHNLLLVG